MILLGRHRFSDPVDDPGALGRRRAGILAVLDRDGTVTVVEAADDLAAAAHGHHGRRYAALYTDLYPSPDRARAASAREGLADIVRDELAELGPPAGARR